MDKFKKAFNLIIDFNKYQDGDLPDYEFIKKLCDYYDCIKNEELSGADKEFLFNLANSVGLPHYFDTLSKFSDNSELEHFSLETMANCLRELRLYTKNNIKLHKFQKKILDKFGKGQPNRFFLSASTSFGKTFLVYEIISKMNYNNVLLIFPSIALLTENFEKISSDPMYRVIKEMYNVNTLSNGEIKTNKGNIFLFTPERYLSFLDFHESFSFNFVFVDEVYKMDNDYLVEEEMKENERDVAYRLSLFYSLMDRSTDVLLSGPYIEFSDKNSKRYNPSFDLFLEDYRIELLNYNEYEIVNKGFHEIENKKKTEKFLSLIKDFYNKGESVIVYCSLRADTEKYAKKILEDDRFDDISTEQFKEFNNHLQHSFQRSDDWIVTKALKKGVGIHHGLIPKYIQKEIINLFNNGILKVLLSTTTITEGVNTVAKNVLVLSHKKGLVKELKTFDALNIAGRAGRFMNHYKGNVYVLDDRFIKIINGKDEPIKHKNYDLTSPKQDIDLLRTKDIYLTQNDKKRKLDLVNQIQNSLIPREILEKYKVISEQEKIQMFNTIKKLSNREKNNLKRLITYFSSRGNIDYDGFEVILKIVHPFVKNTRLRQLMTIKQKDKGNCVLTAMVWKYLRFGFNGMINNYEVPIDKNVRETTNFVYNTLKYQVVKYFGVFNVMYKYYLSITENRPFDEVTGIDLLLMKFEYNAVTECGRIASDYGVPHKIIEYFEDKERRSRIQFDEYEQIILRKVEKLINN